MNDLIEGLRIFAEHLPPDSHAWRWPTNCSHDLLTVCVSVSAVTDPAARERLEQLGFLPDTEQDCWYSHRFGSA